MPRSVKYGRHNLEVRFWETCSWGYIKYGRHTFQAGQQFTTVQLQSIIPVLNWILSNIVKHFDIPLTIPWNISIMGIYMNVWPIITRDFQNDLISKKMRTLSATKPPAHPTLQMKEFCIMFSIHFSDCIIATP